MRLLLVSTYELGHQPIHLASPAGSLRRAGHDVRCLDVSVQPWDAAAVEWADAVAFSVPMHTAMRLALPLAAAVKRDRPEVPVCFYGLYARMSRDTTMGVVTDGVFAGEYEPAMLAWANGVAAGADVVHLGRSVFALPARDLLPPLDSYARLAVGDAEILVGAVEASHGCSHRCGHCPVPVVYDGRIRIMPGETVVADVAQLVALGARHITYADPDFLNGPHHARRVVQAVHDAFPDLTFDCTTKVEHILAYAELWPDLAGAGCLFVVSAFESVDDALLARLDKGHTAAEASAAVAVLREHGIEVRPSWLPFTPWTTPGSLADLLEFVVAHDLVGNVDPVQYTVRLLLPEGSLLLRHPQLQPHLGGYDAERLSWTWSSPDPAVDELQQSLATLVEERADEPGAAVFDDIARMVASAAGRSWLPTPMGARSAGPTGPRARLTESWFCCSEPTGAQRDAVSSCETSG